MSQSIAGNESFSLIENSSENFNILKTSGLTAGNIIVNEATIKTLNIDDVEFNSVTIDRIIMDPNVNIGVDNGVSGQSDLPTIAIGRGAGSTDQGAYSIAIGTNAGAAGQASNTIILSAAATAQDSTSSGTILLNASEDVIPTPSTTGFFVNPIRELTVVDGSVQSLMYDQVSKEITGGPVTVTQSISALPSIFNYWIDGLGSSLLPALATTPLPLGISTIQIDFGAASISYNTDFTPVITWGSFDYTVTGVTQYGNIVGCSLATIGGTIGAIVITINVGFEGLDSTDNLIAFDYNLTYVPA
jgi:hypothetical protein